MAKLLQAGRVLGSGGEHGMVEVRNHPKRMRFGKFSLHPVELRAVFQIAGARGTRFGVAGAVEREKLSQTTVGEIVIARRLVLWKREVVQDGREIAMAFGFVSVVVAEGGEERNRCEQRLIRLEELGTPIFVAR